MKQVLLLIKVLIFVVLGGASALSQERVLRIGLVAPDDGSLSLLGTQLRAGFYIHEQQFIDKDPVYELIEETEICDSDNAADTAFALEEAQIDIVVGFLCVETLVAALPVLKQNNIPVINVNIRSDIVRDEAARLGYRLYSVAPRASDQAKYAAQYILKNWGDKSVALVEDGTIHNRELVDAIRLKLEDSGFQPVVLDNFRPGQDKQFGLARRLAKSNITHVFIGASRLDTAVIARDAASIGVEFTFAGGDTLRAADEDTKLPNGAIAILADLGLVGENANEARQKFDQAGIFPDKFPLLGYAMAELLTELAKNRVKNLNKPLKANSFDTVIGPINFDRFGTRKESAFNAMIWQDGRFVSQVETQ